MERFALDDALKDEIRALAASPAFIKLVQSHRRNGVSQRVSLRPVDIAGERRLQCETVCAGRVAVKNLAADEAAARIEEILSQKGARELHAISTGGDIHVRVTRKGRVSVSRSAAMSRPAPDVSHDRRKKTPLDAFDSAALLRAVGIADGSGAIRASMRRKYDQVNEFLKIVGETVPPPPEDGRARPFVAVDCGCGKAYLTLALYFYLTRALGYSDVRVFGIDRREDVAAAARSAAAALDVADRVEFIVSDLADAALPAGVEPTLVVSLHACDTATDEALARAVEWKARYALAAPCCQHELQKVVGAADCRAGADFAGLLRCGILRERLCDLLTDSFRAMIMRILGFRVQVVEFVSPDATARNVMLKCSYGTKPGQPGPVGEYLALRDAWRVVPWLETRLGERIGRHLSRFA